MNGELTKELCVQKYKELKVRKGVRLEYREFLAETGIDKRALDRVFGSKAFSKLQIAAGDVPNKLELERTPVQTIMQQYGRLVMEVGYLPPYSEWSCRGLKPTDGGLRKKPHELKWSDMPRKFAEWVQANRITGYESVLELINDSLDQAPTVKQDRDVLFERLVSDVRTWIPARRRNSEAEYKIELRKHLESLRYELNEEFGESRCDLLIHRKFTIEVKKDPDLGEYDRLFGQLARHLQHSCKVIALILEPSRKDKLDGFVEIVDKYLNVVGSVEIITR